MHSGDRGFPAPEMPVIITALIVTIVGQP